MPKVEIHIYDELLKQVDASFQHEVSLLSALGLCALMDVLCQEYFLNMKVRQELGFPFPTAITSEQVRQALDLFEKIKRNKVSSAQRSKEQQGNKYIFEWSFQNMTLVFDESLEEGEEPRTVKFTEADAKTLYQFRCAMLHELGTGDFALVSHPRRDGERSHDLGDMISKPILETIEGKTTVRIRDLFEYLQQVSMKVSLQAFFNVETDTDGKVVSQTWIPLGKFLTTSEDFVDG
jgi:hypothetical protein